MGLNHAIYLPLAYNPNVFFSSNEQKDDRLLFVGAWSPDRQELIEQIPLPSLSMGKDGINSANQTVLFTLTIFL